MEWKRETILHEVEHCMYQHIEQILDEEALDSQDLDDLKDCLKNICMARSVMREMDEAKK
jgi:hypothetical protein